ncbi:MAG: 4-(cytidine 5'-diphospho)-2-C-methyl-D-erythritol kinase [Pseudomonadota bacterium]|nr:4-(cytidine 5'-diphospho)-2-C-methyl-D-erythritol kinase [Alphaproteobacteria bacterium]
MRRNPEPPAGHAPAKLNLYLHVLGRDAGGYHQIESLAAFTRFGDRIEVEEGDDLTLQVEGAFAADCGAIADNLAFRAARLLARHASRPARAALRLHKNVPVAAGLGGGSSDAAAVIRSLMKHWRMELDESVLSALALELGADVPVCLRGRPAIMRGVGEQLTDAPEIPSCYALLVNPGVALSTKAVFENLRGRFSEASSPLPERFSDVREMAQYLGKRKNDLQAPAMELAPEIQTVLDALDRAPGCLLARMSGSGATCFGLFARASELAQAANAMARAHPGYWMTQTRLA